MQKRFFVKCVSLLIAVLLCVPAFLTFVTAEEPPAIDYTLEIDAKSSKCSRSDMLEIFGDSLLSSASYGIATYENVGNINEITLLSSYNVSAPGIYVAYKTTAKTGSLLNKKPDWTKAVSKIIEIKLYYTATLSVSGNDDGEILINGNAATDTCRLYQGTEYVISGKPVEGYDYALTGVDENTAFLPSSDVEVSVIYTKNAYATVSLTVGDGGSAQIVSNGTVVSDRVSEGEGFSVETTPDASNRYYTDSVVIIKNGEPYEGTSVEAVADGEVYEIFVSFSQVEIILPDVEVSYLDIENGNYEKLEECIISNISFVPKEFADGATYEIKYLAGNVLGIEVYEKLDYNPLLSSNHKFGYSSDDGSLLLGNTETLKVTCKNGAFPGISLVAKVTATVTDTRIPTEITSSETVTITYGDDLKKAVLGVITITGEDGETVVFDESKIALSPESLDVKLLENQEVEVMFSGNSDYAPSVGTVQVYVKQAPCSIDVKSQTIIYEETPAIEVIADPENLDYILCIAGIDGDATGFVSIYIPQNLQELMTIDLGFFSINFYESLKEAMKDGISFLELKELIDSFAELVNSEGMEDLAASMEFNLESFQTVLNLLSSLPTVDINAKITLGNPPKNAGVYVVGAVTATLNYKIDADIAYLFILPKTDTPNEPLYLTFNSEINENHLLSYEEALEFAFGGKLNVGENVVESDNIKSLYLGIGLDGTPVLLDETPAREPGVYTEFVLAVGGNYFPEPIARVYAVDRVSSVITATATKVVYDGCPHAVEYSVSTEIDTEKLLILYSGENYLSTEPPVNAGTYTVILEYFGDLSHKSDSAVSELVIEKAPITVNVSSTESVVYGQLDLTAGVNVEVIGVPNGETFIATPYIVENENYPNVGTYKVSASFAPNENYQVTVNEAELTITPRKATVMINNQTKTFGESDPEFTYTATGVLDGDDLMLEFARDDGDGVDDYEIRATAGNANYDITFDFGVLTIVEESTEDVIGASAIKSAALALGSEITLNYYVALTPEQSSATMRFTMNGTTTIVSGIKENDEYVFSFSVTPQCMGDNIKAELILENEVLDSIATYSVRQNCLNLLEKEPSDELRTLIADLLEYGAMAQIYVSYKTDALVNKGITGKTVFTPIADDNSVRYNMKATTNSSYKFISAGVYFDSVNRLYFKFYANDVTNTNFEVVITDQNGNKVSRLPSSFEKVGKDIYVVYTDPICASELQNFGYTVTLNQVSYSGKNRISTPMQKLSNYSLSSYVFDKQNGDNATANLAKALYNYGLSAAAYRSAQ